MPEECFKVWVFTVTTTTQMRLNFNLFFFSEARFYQQVFFFCSRNWTVFLKAKLIEFTRFISDFLM